jgi:two-component system phosphate regulon sensor histidine kinase PhoR
MGWDYWRLITLLSIAGFLGLLFGHMMAFLFVAALAYAIWLQRSWNQLWQWLLNPKKSVSPSAEGVIDEVCRHIELMRRQNKGRKKKLSNYLKRFQSATSALPDAIVVLGEYGEVDWANKAAQNLLGIHYPKDSRVRVSNLIRDPAFQPLIENTTTANVVTIDSPLNSNIQIEVKLVRYMGSARMLIARDITQTIKLQRMRRDFVANVSHELRTPLTVLRGYLETLNPEAPTEVWQAALPVMQQQTERMHLMIKDLLVLSQLETGEKPLTHIATDIGTLLKGIIRDAHELEQFNHHQISLHCETENWLEVDVDELRSAISNLVYNAVKYTPAKTEIVVTYAEDTSGPYIEVADNGDGIAEQHLDRLTERFYRVDRGRAQDAGGTGLGLAIVKHVLERHGAKLIINSELGRGTQFTCRFSTDIIAEKSPKNQ